MATSRLLPQVHSDPQVMGGTPVFVGSRLPIETVLACVDAGVPWDRLLDSWPWLTAEHLEAARAWRRDSPHIAAQRWLRTHCAGREASRPRYDIKDT
jgi:uncharacterized protein (DUF433 family)